MAIIEVSVTGGSTLMDQEDRLKFCLEVGASIWISRGYAIFWYQGKSYFLHRWIMDAKPGEEVSHLDGNPLNNSKLNLKICTRSENCKNLNDKLRSTNKSGYRGVSLHKASQKWQATIRSVDEKLIHLGLFDSKEEAHAAYQRAAERYGFVSKLPREEVVA